MKLQIAKRQQAKIKLALQGPSGCGKTIGALKLANGLCPDWSKIALVDTENYSASLYAHLGQFSVINIPPPFPPEKYIDAIRICENAGMEVIIIDSMSHEWEGSGGILDVHGNMAGNSFTNWSKLTPRHNSFVQAILQSKTHIIATIRSKQEYVLNEKNGRHVPEKVGLKAVQRDGTDYEFTCVFDLDIKHNATASKDRTGLFMDKPEFQLTSGVGQIILAWCNEGADIDSQVRELIAEIDSCKSYEELKLLFLAYPQFQYDLQPLFTKRKNELNNIIPITKIQQNGSTISK